MTTLPPCRVCESQVCENGTTCACVWSGARPYYCQNIYCEYICYDKKKEMFMCSRGLELHCHASKTFKRGGG